MNNQGERWLAKSAPVFPTTLELTSRAVPTPLPLPYRTAQVNSGPHKLNSGLGIILTLVVALAPIPLGSNRPAFWMLWAIVVGLIAITYGLALIWLKAPVRWSPSQFRYEAVGLIIVLSYLFVQTLPIGQWLPSSLTIVPSLGENIKSLSLDAGSTRLSLVTFATYGLLFLLFAQVAANRQRARVLLLTLFLVVAAFAVYGLVSLTQFGDTLLGFEKQFYRGSATGTFINRNSFATFLAAGLAMGPPLLLDGFNRLRGGSPVSRWLKPAVVSVGLSFIAATLLATGSRMGAIAGAGGGIVSLVLCLIRSESSGRAKLWVSVIAVASLAAVVVLYGTGTIERLIFTRAAEEDRGELYRQVWQAIWQRPWTGFGGGSFGTVFPLFQHAPLPGVLDRAHSTYLALWFEMGFIVGSIPLLIIAALLLRAIRGLWDRSNVSLSVATIGVVTAFGIHSAFDFSAEVMADAFLLTAILSLGAGRTGAPRDGER